MPPVSARSIFLAEGRRLGFHEFGERDGVPCMYTPGWPASGIAGGVYDDAAQQAGVRWISLDKPGYGQSHDDPRRSLLRYAADIGELADQLGLERFASVGESGGGPHALAMAHALADRLTTTLVIAGIGPAQEKGVPDGMKPTNRLLIGLARRAPWLLRAQMALLSRIFRNPKNAKRWEESLQRSGPEGDRRAWREIPSLSLMVDAVVDALGAGGRAAAQELTMITRPWGFPLSQISGPVEVWHGTEDANVPVAMARRMIDEIPQCAAKIVEGQGHCVGAVLRHELMRAVVHSR